MAGVILTPQSCSDICMPKHVLLEFMKLKVAVGNYIVYSLHASNILVYYT